MTATYDPTDLDTTTASGRLNVVRFLVGDIDVTDAQVQDEEITFWLTQSSDNTYSAAASLASGLASQYAKLVSTKLDGALSAEYNDLYERYQTLADQLRSDGQRLNGNSLGIFLGGVPSTTTSYAFYRGQFRHPDCSTLKEVP